MTRESPLRAQPDSRILDVDAGQQQGHLFDELDHQAEEQLLADYRQRYGLAEDPFSDDYSFPLFTGAGRRQVLDQLLHLVQFSNSLLVVLGEYGIGKTRLAHAFMDSLSETDLLCYLEITSGQSLETIFTAIVQAFNLPFYDAPVAEKLLTCLEDFIEQQPDADTDGLAVVVLDNAHLLDDQTISVLTALLQSFPQQNRFHLVMVGEPPLMSRLERLSPENLLINDFFLPAFNLAESVDYLNFRMEMADYLGSEIFSDSMVDPWWRQAQGQLGVLHELAQERLLESVTPKQNLQRNKRAFPVVHIIAIALLMTIVAVVLLYMGDEGAEPPTITAVTPQSSQAMPNASPQATVATPQSVNTTPATTTASATASSLALTSTDTPVQPLLQSLPSGTVSAQPVKTDNDYPQEKIVPLAHLPSAQPATQAATQTTAPASSTSEPVYEEPVQAAPVVTMEPVVSAKPVIKEVPVIKEELKPVAKEKIISTSAIGQDRQILNWSATDYTIQLLGVSNHKAALDYVAAQPNKKDLIIFKSKRQGKDWFVVVTGRFASNAQARQAITQLPAVQRDAGPWPRDVKTIQNEIRAAQ